MRANNVRLKKNLFQITYCKNIYIVVSLIEQNVKIKLYISKDSPVQNSDPHLLTHGGKLGGKKTKHIMYMYMYHMYICISKFVFVAQ